MKHNKNEDLRVAIQFVFATVMLVALIVWSTAWDLGLFDSKPDANSLGVAQIISQNYELAEQRDSKLYPDDKAYFYQADKSVSAVAAELAAYETPLKMTDSNDNRMLLVYPQGMVDIQPDQNNTGYSIIELMTKEYAANNYVRNDFDGSGFLTGFVAAEILDDLFESKKYKYPPYQNNQTGTGGTWGSGGSVRTAGWFRGGGPSAGK